MKSFNNSNNDILIIKKITDKENRKQIRKMLGLGALWMLTAYLFMYALLYLFLAWNDFLDKIFTP